MLNKVIASALFRYCIVFTVLFFAGARTGSAQQQDSAAYEAQRSKINSLLQQRSAEFGRYDESLNMRTGIFGFQTKKDIRNSNEILRQIVLNDNDIFKELKVLLEYKDLQVKQQSTAVTDHSDRLVRYRASIKQLQDHNQELQDRIKKLEGRKSLANYIVVFLLLVITGGAYLFYRSRKV
ncbi:hypothetical protein [Pedobacter sp. SYP-B3415]|uniref:hypothetical protein n=1 Tax=Pedobacter sp. SYP-B3415 TaxID=2496641 RepID=UPI001F0EA206|nr:hypothetical protein [Pedobacter sp. SYP-B3415]